jgi:hypothetical protein
VKLGATWFKYCVGREGALVAVQVAVEKNQQASAKHTTMGPQQCHPYLHVLVQERRMNKRMLLSEKARRLLPISVCGHPRVLQASRAIGAITHLLHVVVVVAIIGFWHEPCVHGFDTPSVAPLAWTWLQPKD